MNAVKWAYTANWGEKGLSSIVAVVLAGILGPVAFGMVSIAIVYTTILQVFLDQGFITALIQRKDLDDEHLDAVFWMDQTLAIFLVAISVLLSGWWASRNHAPEAANLICVMALDIPLMALSIVQSAILRREMDFRSLSICSNSSALIGGLVGIGMAVAGCRAWSLVGQQLAKDGVNTVLLWRFSHWRPQFKFSWRHLKELTGFSIANFVAQLGIIADMQASSIVLGLFFGPTALGLYRLADRIMNSVVTMTMAAVQMVSLPEFSRLQDQPKELSNSARTCIRLTSIVTVPALSGLAAVSVPLMATLGASWVPAAPVLRILCALGIAIVFAYFTGPMLQALSRPRELAALEWGRMGLGTAILVGVGFLVRNSALSTQIMSIAWARFATGALIVTPIFLYIFMRLSRISFRQVVTLIAPSAFSSACIVAAVFLIGSVSWMKSARPIVTLAAEIAVGGLVGLAVLLGVDRPLRSSAATLLHRNLGRLTPAKQPI
jgi:polysaccharide transporter, PST family